MPASYPLAANTQVYLCSTLDSVLFSLKNCVYAQAARFKGLLRMQSNSLNVTSTDFCLLLFCAKKGLGAFSLKAWSFSCFCGIKGHKVKSPSLAADIPLFSWELIPAFLVLKYGYRSDRFLFLCPEKWTILYFERFYRSVLWLFVENRCLCSSCQAGSGAIVSGFALNEYHSIDFHRTATVASVGSPNYIRLCSSGNAVYWL